MTLSDQPLSPLDGRYHAVVATLGEHLSEAGLNRARVKVEVEWLVLLCDLKLFGCAPLSESEREALRSLHIDFDQSDIDELARIEATTRHDVKAVEYLIRARLESVGLSHLSEMVHFACTSEDINNLAYALVIQESINDIWLPSLEAVISRLRELAAEYKSVAMLSRTHGQPATPTTMGKELAVFVHRLSRMRRRIAQTDYVGKLNGATGTFGAHVVAAPNIDWIQVSHSFVDGLGLAWNPLTTQIESHDWQVDLYSDVSHTNRILHNLSTDIWMYISLGYFRQIPVAAATGSSTMPHKINPIRFENAEANLEVSSALLESLGATLATSRLQRDLTDSTTQRNIGVAIGHSLLALDNIRRGLHEIDLDRAKLGGDLEENWEVLAEAVQTLIRAEVTAGHSHISDPYALLKDLTRGKRLTQEALATFVRGLDVSDDAKARLLELTPATYVGLAERLVDDLLDES